MKKFLFILILTALLLPRPAAAQKYFTLRGKVTYNYFSAGDLKDMQRRVLEGLLSFGLPARKIQSFPPYYGMQVQLLIPVADTMGINAGVFYESYSTGARVHYRDYSGEEKFDQILKGNSFGIMGEKNIGLNSFTTLNFNLGISLIWATYEMTIYEQIYDYKKEDNVELKTTTVGFTPGAAIAFNLYMFTLTGSVGYQFCLPAHFSYNWGVTGRQAPATEFSPGLNGLRLGLGAAISL